jgi:beta-glucanase (GH16 family)
MPDTITYLTVDDLAPLLDRLDACETAIAKLTASPLPPAPTPSPTPAPQGIVSLAWNAPAEGLRVAGSVVLRLAGKGFKNVEVFIGGRMAMRCSITGAGTVATAILDTTKYPNGSLSLTAHAWDSLPGQPSVSDALAVRTIIVANSITAVPVVPAPTTPIVTPPSPTPVNAANYKLVKDWDFGTAAKLQTLPDVANEFRPFFVYEGGTLDTLSGNGEWERYKAFNPTNHALTANTLNLTASVEGGLRDGGISSGMLRSKWTGKYGYFEARMRGPAGAGLWPAFWLNPEDQQWPPEIDIVELVSNTPDRDWRFNTHHSVVPGDIGATLLLGSKLDEWNRYYPGGGFDWTAQFHTYAALWTPGIVHMFVDDVEIGKWGYTWQHNDGSDGGAAHVLVNLAVGGNWPGAPTDPSIFPAALEVDFVRVWQN